MERHFQKELESLKTSLIKMGSVVEENIAFAIRAVLEKSSDLARKVIETDKRVDSLEIEIDNTVIDLLALQQPVASDLRFIIAAQKINNDLERIGDHAVNIAYRGISLNKEPQLKPYMDLPRMGEIVQAMTRDIIKAFLSRDPHLARSVYERDDTVDALDDQIFRELITYTVNDPTAIPRAMHLVIVSRCMERIADHATNIAENIIFIETGEMMRHQAKGKEKK